MESVEKRISDLQQTINIDQVIADFNNGIPRQVDRLLNCLTDPSLDSAELSAILRSFDCVVTQLEDELSEKIVPVILKTTWYRREDYVVEDFTVFISGLLAVRVSMRARVLRALVLLFVGQEQPQPVSTPVSNNTLLTSEQRSIDQLTFNRVHGVLKQIVEHVPELAKSVESDKVEQVNKLLLHTFKQAFPSRMKSTYQVGCYMYNLFRFIPLVPGISAFLLDMIMQKVAQIDTELDLDHINKEDDATEEEEDFNMDIDKDDHSLLPCMERTKMDGFAAKLDTMMFLWLKYIRETCFSGDRGVLDLTKAQSVYRMMQNIFDRQIIHLHQPCQIHFAMYYLCSFHDSFWNNFVDNLWGKVRSEHLGYDIRQSAVWYLSDLLARAQYIPVEALLSRLRVMCEWLAHYTSKHCHNIKHFRTHMIFHTVCHSVFFLLTYRHAELLDNPSHLQICRSLGIQELVSSALNPLDHGDSQALTRFARVMKVYEIAFCDGVLEDNRQRLLLKKCISNGAQYAEAWNYDDDIGEVALLKFPFERYVLSLSQDLVVPLIRGYVDGKRLVDLFPEERSHCRSEQDQVGMCSISPLNNSLLEIGNMNALFKQNSVIVYGNGSQLF